MTSSELRGRVMGIDYGEVRTGVAVSDPLGITAQPRIVLREKEAERLAERLSELAHEIEAVEIVLGLPINMNGRYGKQAYLSENLGRRLEELTGLPVRFWDERLSSAHAETVLRGRGSRQRKAKVDVVAAQIILQSYLDARSRGKSAQQEDE